jgi:HNH endonuclease
MRKGVSTATKLKVAIRAYHKCEYCRIHEDDLFISFHVDHIVALKHGGSSDLQNLAYSCAHCNQHKGTDFTTFLGSYKNIVSIFHPRNQNWEDHFRVEKGMLLPVTEVGEATIKLLKINNADLIALREILQELGRYP